MSMNDRQQAHGQPDDEMEPEGQRQPAAGDGNPEKLQMPAGDAPQQVGQPMQWTAGETPQPLPYSRPVNPPQSVNRPQPVGHSQPPVAGQWAPASEPRPMPPIPSGTGRPGMRQPIQSYPPYPSQLYPPYPPYPPYSSAQRPVAPPIPVAQPVPIDPVKARRRWLRGTVTRHAGLIFAYQGVFMGVNVLASFVIGIILGLSGAAGRGTLTAESLSAVLVQLTGVIMLLTVLGGMGFILPMRRRMIFRRDFWLGEPGHARMKPSWLLTFIILVMAIQTAIVLIQLGFSMFGTTLQSPTSDTSARPRPTFGCGCMSALPRRSPRSWCSVAC